MMGGRFGVIHITVRYIEKKVRKNAESPNETTIVYHPDSD